MWRITRLGFLLGISVLTTIGCNSVNILATAPTPTPTATPLPMPSITPSPMPTLTVYEDRNIPGCDGFAVLPEPFQFTWPGTEDAQDASEWGYYHCAPTPAVVAAFYREKMTKPPYNWQEFNWVELPEGTLGVYFHTVYQRWFYLWVLPAPANQGSYLVLAQRDLGTPLVLPCCR